MYSSFLNFLQRDVDETWRSADEAFTLSTEYEFTYYLSHSLVIKGWSEVMQGHPESGLELITRGINNHQATGAVLIRNLFLGIMAEACGKSGHIEAGLDLLDEGLFLANRHGERFFEAELHRLKGDLLFKKMLGGNRASHSLQTEAENCFQKALEVSDLQSAKSFELRAGISLGRLYIETGKHSQAETLLVRISDRSHQGFNKKDLADAQKLLSAFSS